MRLALATALVLAAASSKLEAQQIVGRNDRVYTLSERIGSGGRIGIFASQGTITITEAAGSTMEYRAEKDEGRGNIDDIGFVVLRSGDGVTICAVYDEDDECRDNGIRRDRRDSGNRRWNNRARANITVSVPRGSVLHTSSGNGEVSVAAAVAEAHVSSGNGKVRVSRVTGRLELSTGNGEVTVDHVGGPVQASTGNGDVSITATNGPVNVSSGNGDIFASMDRLTGDDDLTFSSGNGRIELVVPADFGAEVEASTGNGRVSTDFPITVIGRITPTRLRGTIGNGGRRLRMSTGNGTMEIRKRA